MKIRSLTIDQKKNFKLNVPIYMEFLIATAPKLSKCSHKLYSRALSFIAVENDMINLTPKSLAMKLTKEVLTNNDFTKIVGEDTSGNQNIRLSAFRNLVEPYKDDLQQEISCVSFQSLNSLVSKKGCHIRKKISDSKKDEDKNMTDILKEKNNWIKLQKIVTQYNQRYDVTFTRFLKTNEIPDYLTLRDAVICNLYCNNYHSYDEMNVYVILHNEYKTCHMWINHEPPPEDKTNYFWINLSTNKHFIIIQKSHSVGTNKRVPDGEGGTKLIDSGEKIKKFKLSRYIAGQLLFLKTTFNERNEIPIFKNDTRDGPMNDQKWIRTLNKIFHPVSTSTTCKTIRKIIQNEIQWNKLTENQRFYLMTCLDNNPKKKLIEEDGLIEFC